MMDFVLLCVTFGSRFCTECERHVSGENLHCFECNDCTSKAREKLDGLQNLVIHYKVCMCYNIEFTFQNGLTYQHCFDCGECRKPRYVHCVHCKKCTTKVHVCENDGKKLKHGGKHNHYMCGWVVVSMKYVSDIYNYLFIVDFSLC